MTDTPRTDAVYLEHRYWSNEDEATEAIEGLRDLARTLERELARMERLRFGADADRRLLRHELAQERQVSADHVSLYKERVALANKYLDALAAEKGKVRVLREALMALRDQQNNADRPLCRAHWQMAMDETGLALAITEDTQ